MVHYKLKDGIYFVQGATRGAILDTSTGNVYSVNRTATTIITGQVDHTGYWQQLVGMNLAEACDQSVGLPNLPRMVEIRLKFIWFEITTSDCNECCEHCYAESMPPSYRERLGLPIVKSNSDAPRLPFAEWLTLIEEGYRLGARNCQFIGGEPFVYREGEKDVLDLAAHARQVGYETIEVFTNATLLTQQRIQRIEELGLKIAVSLYSHDPQIHDSITRLTGSHAKTMASLQALREKNIPTRVEIVAMRKNEGTIPETIELIHNMGFRTKGSDPLRPKGRGDKIELMPSPETEVRYGVIKAPNFRANRNTVAHYSSGHSCLAGKITITETGDVLPCIFSRNQVMGNVKESGGLEPVVMGAALQQVWNTTKDNVMVCRDCEYRYVCFDCRPLSEGHAEGQSDFLHAPYPRCSYNPHTGEWGQGLWRMNGEGPYYNRNYAPVIQRILAKDSAVQNGPTGH